MAKVITTAYLVLVFVALIPLLMAGRGDSLAGIYLVLVTVPWSWALGWLVSFLKIDSQIFNALFLLAGGLINGFILYAGVSLLTGKVFARHR